MESPRIQLLGDFCCSTSDHEIHLPLSAQRILAFLALRGPSNRNLVAGSLWPEVTEAHALASLRTGLWRVNKSLPGVVMARGAALDIGGRTRVDCREQQSLASALLRDNSDNIAYVQAGLPLLTSRELLTGWYDDWVIIERERLSQLRLHAIETTARLLMQRGQLGTALALALEAVCSEPMRETANALLISVYLAEGNVSDAIHQYRFFRRLLWDELGIEPSARVASLLPQCKGVDTLVTDSDG